ncbi:transposase [Sphingobacterium daejeonense]|uniref:transposase n=1 Tax=Sphingobacterium daejeonense TaxID=371142 RepID=UPI0021D27FB0|nr:transposase [Sphingobacterium daejeonense]
MSLTDLPIKGMQERRCVWFAFGTAPKTWNTSSWTNNFSWKPATVAALYKERWEIETFFKHLKQRLKVTSFVGTSENAVYIQIWTALIGILLFKYIQKKAKYNWNLSNLVNFIRMNIFVKIDLWKWADDPFISGKPPDKKGQYTLI